MRANATALITAVTLSTVASVVTAAESPGIPEKALDAMKFFVGKWEGESRVNGEEISKGSDERSWVDGKYCLTMKGCGTEQGVGIHYSGVCGWDEGFARRPPSTLDRTRLIGFPTNTASEDPLRGISRIPFRSFVGRV